MDEENQGFAIPANRPLGEGDIGIEVTPVPESDLFMVFTNDTGDQAVILTPIESAGGEILERHGRPELEEYAATLFETGDDPMELQIGTIFEGETAEADAQAEATRLDEEFNPGEGATDEDLISAVDMARNDAGGAAPANPFPGDMEGGEEIGAEGPNVDLTAPLGAPEELPPAGEEPMLDQLRRRNS